MYKQQKEDKVESQSFIGCRGKHSAKRMKKRLMYLVLSFPLFFNRPIILWNREKLSWNRGTGS